MWKRQVREQDVDIIVAERWRARRKPWPGSTTWRNLRERHMPEAMIRTAIRHDLRLVGPLRRGNDPLWSSASASLMSDKSCQIDSRIALNKEARHARPWQSKNHTKGLIDRHVVNQSGKFIERRMPARFNTLVSKDTPRKRLLAGR